jgi:assimilatory nitrate reductase catalytic subunit
MAWLPEDRMLAAREALKPLMAKFPYASCVPFGRERSGILFRAAAHDTPDDALLEQIEKLLNLDGATVLRYADKKKGQRRSVHLVRKDEQAMLEGFMLAGDTSAQSWIKTLLQDELPAQAYGRLLLSPGAKAPMAVHSRGKQICTCFNVTDEAIAVCLANTTGNDDARLEALQGALKCGTNCGSCLPELKRLVRQPKTQVPA